MSKRKYNPEYITYGFIGIYRAERRMFATVCALHENPL